MNAQQQEIDRDAVKLPGDDFAPTVARASDARLQRCEEKDLAYLRSLLRRHRKEPTADGLAPSEWLQAAVTSRQLREDARAIEHVQRRILAIRAELAHRREQRKAEAAERSREARERLLALLEQAPTLAVELRRQVDAALAVSGRAEEIADDLRLLSLLLKLSQEFEALREGVARAATALDQPTPELGQLPELPNDREMARLFTLLRTAIGDARRTPDPLIRVAEDAMRLAHDLK